jgi:hypothetical protein
MQFRQFTPLQDTAINSFIALIHSALPGKRAERVYVLNTFFFTKLYGGIDAEAAGDTSINYLAVQRYEACPSRSLKYPHYQSMRTNRVHIVILRPPRASLSSVWQVHPGSVARTHQCLAQTHQFLPEGTVLN